MKWSQHTQKHFQTRETKKSFFPTNLANIPVYGTNFLTIHLSEWRFQNRFWSAKVSGPLKWVESCNCSVSIPIYLSSVSIFYLLVYRLNFPFLV